MITGLELQPENIGVEIPPDDRQPISRNEVYQMLLPGIGEPVHGV